MFDVSSTSALGVNIPDHIILLPDVIVANEPFCTVISALESKPLTASENTRVTVAVSPIFNAVSDNVNDDTVGGVALLASACVLVIPSPYSAIAAA